MQVLKLSPDRFTPLSRTPWAGEQIFRCYKSGLVPSGSTLIGEAWEVSCDPDFPSEVLDNGLDLADLIRQNSNDFLSQTYVARKGATCEILVKLLNAASPLSVQVHPRDDDPNLKLNECGKPESWLILDAVPGSGLYLGFSRPLEKEFLRQLLLDDADLRSYLHFVPVQAGDYFEIQPGVPHAIGPGVTLLEPQRVLLGKSGKTYRFWDWGRRYGSDGTLDMLKGKPRELHIDEGLRLINPKLQVGDNFSASLKRDSECFSFVEGAQISRYPANDYYQVLHIKMRCGAVLNWQIKDGFAALISLKGKFFWQGVGGVAVHFRAGEPGFLPYAAFPLKLEAEADCELAIIIPFGATLSWS